MARDICEPVLVVPCIREPSVISQISVRVIAVYLRRLCHQAIAQIGRDDVRIGSIVQHGDVCECLPDGRAGIGHG